MSTCVYCLAPTEEHAVRLANRLYNSGIADRNISMVHPDRSSARDVGHQNSTKASEGAAAGASTGALLGGALGWAAGIGALAIPGVGPLIAAGPILATLSGLAAGGTIGGITGALVGTGIPEYEAQQYEGKLREGNVLISVHSDDSGESARVREIVLEERADNISTGPEASVPKPHLPNEAVARREPSTKL